MEQWGFGVLPVGIGQFSRDRLCGAPGSKHCGILWIRVVSGEPCETCGDGDER